MWKTSALAMDISLLYNTGRGALFPGRSTANCDITLEPYLDMYQVTGGLVVVVGVGVAMVWASPSHLVNRKYGFGIDNRIVT